MPNKYLIQNCGSYALKQFEELVDSLLSMGAIFTTAKELAERWDEIGSSILTDEE